MAKTMKFLIFYTMLGNSKHSLSVIYEVHVHIVVECLSEEQNIILEKEAGCGEFSNT